MKARRRVFSDIFGIVTLLFIFVFLIFSSVASRCAVNGMKLCADQLIPTVFPLLVLNGLLLRCGFAHKISRIAGKAFSKVFGIGGENALPFIIGTLCGSPSGAASVGGLVREGITSKENGGLSIFISSSVSAGFLIATVGGKLLFSYERGLALWMFQFISIISLSVIFRHKNEPGSNTTPKNEGTYMPFASALSQSLKDSTQSMLAICGTVIFFSSLSGILISLPFLPVSAKCFITAFLELTTGVSYIASNLPSDTAFILICGAVGWSGISMHCQVAAVSEGGTSLRTYLVGKLFCCLICIFLALISLETGII